MALRARIEAAYERAAAPAESHRRHEGGRTETICNEEKETPGGFLPHDSSDAGGFLPEDTSIGDKILGEGSSKPSSSSKSLMTELPVSKLPHALCGLGLKPRARRDVQELLELHAESRGKRRVVTRDNFVQALETVLDDGTDARRSKRRRTNASYIDRDAGLSDASEISKSDAGDSDVSDDFQPVIYSASERSESPTIEVNEGMRLATVKNPELGDELRAHGRLLFRLLLERLPLAVPATFHGRPRSVQIRTNVTEEEVSTRRIGMDELRYAAQSLGETPTTNELAEMLYEASTFFQPPGAQRPVITAAPRIGVDEFTYMAWRVGIE